MESKTLADIRSEVCNAALIWLSIGAIVILGLAVASRPAFIPTGILVGAGAFIVLVNLVTLFRHRLPYVLRAGLIVGLAVLAGSWKVLLYGAPFGFLDFALTVLMAAAFFGERTGIIAALACVAGLATAYWGFAYGIIPAPTRSPPPLASSTWVLGVAMLVVTTFGPLIVISRLAQHVDLERQRAQDASDAKSKFLAMMSHELKTPLNAIMGFSEAMGMDDARALDSRRYREYAGDIHRSATHLLGIVDDLLNLARLEIRQFTAASERLDVASELNRAAAMMDGLATKAGLSLKLDLVDALPPVTGDPKLIQQIMLNLLSNATKFTPAGGAITIRAREVGGHVRIEVTDTGIGIPAEEIPHLGQPFRQAKHSTVRNDGGAGLGLALAKTFTELQRGEFDLRSTVGVGTTVAISLPISDKVLPSARGAL